MLSNTLSLISLGHLDLFATKSSFEFNALFNVAALYGFWRGGYELPKDTLPYWYLIFFFFLFLVVHGFIVGKNCPQKGKYIKAIGLLAVVSVILATGVSLTIFQKQFLFLYNHVPFYAGFREPHKFIGIVVFAYAYLGAIGLDNFARKIKKWDMENVKTSWPYMVLVIMALLAPFIYTHSMLFGFNGQLKSTDYPSDWYDVDEILSNDPLDFNVLFLPWHGYMDFKWIPNQDKRIANPANQFFSKPVIQADNLEAGDIYSQSSNPFSKYVEYLLQNRGAIDNFGYYMVPLNVKYVILTKEVDYQRYMFLWEQNDLELIIETENLYLFRNKNEVSRVYGVRQIPKFLDSDYLNSPPAEKIEFKPVEYINNYPGKYSPTENPKSKYVIFTVPYSTNWIYGTNEPINKGGVINIYENRGMLPIENKYSMIFLVLYGISFTVFICLIYLLIKDTYWNNYRE